MRNFNSNPDNAPAKQAEYKAKPETMSDAELLEEAGKKIWLSAYANNNPISCYHWQCDATYDESARRGKPEIYSRAWKREAESCR